MVFEKKILLVEGDSLIAMDEKMTLEKYGYKVITALTGEEAMEAVDSSSGIDLILMDIELGSGIPGTMAAEKILENHDLPIIFLSSHAEQEIVEKTEGVSSYGYIVKNTGETVLIASIKMAFRLFEAKMKEREKEEALRERNYHLQLALKAASMGTFEWNVVENRNVWSDELLSIFGTTADKFGGNYEAYLNYIPPESRDKVDEIVKKFIDTTLESDVIQYEHEIVRDDGSHGWIDIRARLFMDEQGHPLRFSGIAIDITQRKQAEEQLKRSLIEKEMLLREVHLRVKINFQVIESLIKRQSQNLTDKKMIEIFSDLQKRVRSISFIHGKLYQIFHS